ncbi:MAG: DUF86 domain-containing protein, partial [Alphaproteobacteria bacterium]|nr:DUF86 domain-containing protein [Alphaproteobacteria bacterium]
AGMDAAGFLASRLVQDAVIWNILSIGEAAGNVMRKCPKFAAEQPDIPWRAAYDTRNRVAHGYDSINMKIVWSIIADELPMLGAKLRALLAQPGR